MLQQLKLVWGINLKIKQIKMEKKHSSGTETRIIVLFCSSTSTSRLDLQQVNILLTSLLVTNMHTTSPHTVYLQLQQRLVTPPNTAEPTASTVSRSASCEKCYPSRPSCAAAAAAADWLTAGLIFDERLGMNQRLLSHSVWCREHPNLRYCYPSKSCPAIHRAEDRVLHSHSESFTAERNTMKSE